MPIKPEEMEYLESLDEVLQAELALTAQSQTRIAWITAIAAIFTALAWIAAISAISVAVVNIIGAVVSVLAWIYPLY
jgi:hypothetical protein